MKAARKRADRRRRGYERALDCLHVRLLPPLMGISLALTLVFTAAWLDNDLKVNFRFIFFGLFVACLLARFRAVDVCRDFCASSWSLERGR